MSWNAVEEQLINYFRVEWVVHSQSEMNSIHAAKKSSMHGRVELLELGTSLWFGAH